MKTLAAGIGAAVAALILSTSPTAHAEPTVPECPDPSAPIVTARAFSSDVAVGTKKTKQMKLEVWTHAGCDVDAAEAVIRAPRKTYRVQLKPATVVEGAVYWQGTLAIAPSTLRNSDAGAWPTTYRVTGAEIQTATVTNLVRRATRVTRFNAGPEPVQDDRLTYTGHVERASWTSGRYRDLAGHPVGVHRIWLDGEESELVAGAVTRKDGTFRVTRAYAGPGYYAAVPHENRTTVSSLSRRDKVTTPQ